MKNRNNITLISIFLLVLGLIVCIFYYKNVNKNNEDSEEITKSLTNLKDIDENVASNTEVTIHIVGAVNSPGVYTLPTDSRVQNAINSAGGSTEEADLSKINLAAIIEDAQQIHVPVKGETIDSINTTEEYSEAGLIVNINIANTKELSSLPGIGASTAEKIIEYREANGKFSSKEEVMKVERIGSKTYENIKELIKID